MKTIEINGQKVLAVNVPMDAKGFYVVENWLQWNHSDKSKPDFEFLPIEDCTILADSIEPEEFVKVWYPDAKVVVWEGAFARGIICDCKILTPIIDTEYKMWQSAASLIMQEHGLEGRIVLLTEKTTKQHG